MVAAEAENATDDLDPRVRGLLQEEMREIEAAMQTILSAIVRGQHDVVQEREKLLATPEHGSSKAQSHRYHWKKSSVNC